MNENNENNENDGKTKKIGEMQNYIDELYLLQKKAEERADDLYDNCAGLIKFSKSFIEKAHQLNAETVESTKQATIAANTIDINLKSAHKLYLHSIRMLVISVFITTALIVSWVGVSVHYKNKVSEAKSLYQYFSSKVDKTPIILKRKGKDYVQIKPGSEQAVMKCDGKSDTYAEIRYF